MGKYDDKLKKRQQNNAAEAAKGFKPNVFDLEMLGETEFFSPETGKNKIDIIPYLAGTDKHPAGIAKGDPEYVLVYYKHKGLGPTQRTTVVCPKSTFGKPCPVCEERDKLIADGQEELADSLKPKKYAAYWVVDKLAEEEALKLFDVQWFFFEKELCDASMNPDEDDDSSVVERPVPYAALEGGYSVKFRATDEVFGKAKFKKFKDFRFAKRKEDYDEAILKDTIPLDSLLVVKSYSELKEIIFSDGEEVAPEDDDMLPSSREPEEAPAKKTALAKKHAVEEEPEETPKKKTLLKKSAKEDSDKVTKCPHGHKIGKDIDITEDCEDCEVYKACANAAHEE